MKYDIKEWLDTLRTKTMHGICSGVSEGENEVAGRIRFLAKFKQPKAIALGAIAVVVACVAVFCLGGDNPIVVTQQDSSVQGDASSNADAASNAAQAESTPAGSDSNTGDSDSALGEVTLDDAFTGETITATSHDEYTIWAADLTHDGQDEQIVWDDIAFDSSRNEFLYVQAADSEELVTEDFLWVSELAISTSHAGNGSYSLYRDATGDYLWSYNEAWYSGSCYAQYELFYLSAVGEKITVDNAAVEILTDGMPFTDALNDTDAILDFFETATDYAANSYILVSAMLSIDYLDVTTGETVADDFICSTEAAPVQIIPTLMLENAAPQDDNTSTEGSATELLRAELEALNEKRTANYAEVYAEQNATTISMVLEGYPEEVAAVRYQMDGYSIAIPNDEWEMTSENHWQAINSEQVFFEILCTTEADMAAVAQSCWGEAGAETTLFEKTSRFFYANGQTSHLQFLGSDNAGNYYYVLAECFDEAMEGYGWRMIYIADTLIID